MNKLTLQPDAIGPEDARAVYAAGVSEQALIDAITVCFHFNLVDRVADSLGFDKLDDAGYRLSAQSLLRFGYDLPGPLRLLARRPTW
ncbi:MAG: hypothetical protein L0206_19990 [Actinobacteria bacterium]|nr:hypothetical protein [Actinomycetota bacterium]